MAKLKTVESEDNGFNVSFHISKKEHEAFRNGSKHFLLVALDSLKDHLTIGTLGNSYRIMLPKKFLRQHRIAEDTLPKQAEANVISIGDEKFLTIKLVTLSLNKSHFGGD